jgi:uncharacterized protein YodC (DUF2158 family)
MSEQPSFVPGALVRLKSGGPVMTVERVHESGVVVCLWHDERGTQTYSYQPWVLEAVMPPRSVGADVQAAWEETTAQVRRAMDTFRHREAQEQEAQGGRPGS